MKSVLLLGLFSVLLTIISAYTDSEARQLLSNAGISVNKLHPSTSLNNIRSNSITGIINLKRMSGCSITITGGTESGPHASGSKSHGSGHKLDIRLDSCINAYITAHFQATGTRSDGAALYKNTATGDLYAKEGNHWDILFQ